MKKKEEEGPKNTDTKRLLKVKCQTKLYYIHNTRNTLNVFIGQQKKRGRKLFDERRTDNEIVAYEKIYC